MNVKLLFSLLTLVAALNGQQCVKQRTLLVSMDGFWFGYLHKLQKMLGSSSNILALMKESAHAPHGISPSYPSVTLPNHITMMTGKYIDEHHVVGKSFYDPHRRRTIDFHQLGNTLWKYVKGEPVWATVAKMYGLTKVGCIGWIGCSAPYQGISLINNVPFSMNTSWTYAVNQLIAWLQAGVELGIFYYPYPDMTGHHYGPHSPQMDNELKNMDRRVGVLVSALKQAGLYNSVNLILTSDHGMAAVTRTIVIPPNPNLFSTWVKADSYWLVQPNNGVSRTSVINYLKQFGDASKMKIFRKENIPAYWHFRHSHRISDILVAAEPGYVLQRSSHGHLKGQHGYGNGSSRMKTIFIGHGPSFKNNIPVPENFNTRDTNSVVRQAMCLPQASFATPSYLNQMLRFVKK